MIGKSTGSAIKEYFPAIRFRTSYTVHMVMHLEYWADRDYTQELKKFLDGFNPPIEYRIKWAAGLWHKYVGRYEKRFYDIKLTNGIKVYNCWPKAGQMHSISDGAVYTEDQIAKFRIRVENGGGE